MAKGVPSISKKPSAKVMKKPYGSIIPKKGSRRSMRRPSASIMKTYRNAKVAYIQNNQKKDQTKKWCIDQGFLLGATPKQIANRLHQTGWLSWSTTCPYCGAKLRDSHAKTDRLRNNARVQARCPKRSCHRRIPWTCNHPLLHLGRQGLSIGQQCAIYLSILLGCSHHAISIHLGVSRFTVNAFATKLKTFIANRVVQTQESITFGTDTDDWDEVEVDEVTLSKVTTKDGRIRWANYVGLIRRGIPESLWISRLPDRTTGAKAPGPGPIRSRDWHEIAKTKISGKGIILHSDSARAYMKAYPRVTQTRVVHCKKFINGKWTKPYFTKFSKIKCNMKTKSVMAGTQLIDGVWKLLRKGKSGCHGSEPNLELNIRWAQWKYWHNGKDLFKELGKAIKDAQP